MINEDDKLGSEKNPIALIDHTSDKEVTEEKKGKRGIYWPRKNIAGTEFETAFSNIKNAPNVENAFILNVIQNPNLSSLDMRLAFYFYYKEKAEDFSFSWNSGITFIVDEPYDKKQLKKLIGENGWLNYSNEWAFIEIDKIVPLIEDLKGFNIKVELTELKTSIQKLSDFAYITITPISWEYAHVRSSRTAKSKISGKELTQVYAQNIRIFSRMGDKLIFKTRKKSTSL